MLSNIVELKTRQIHDQPRLDDTLRVAMRPGVRTLSPLSLTLFGGLPEIRLAEIQLHVTEGLETLPFEIGKSSIDGG